MEAYKYVILGGGVAAGYAAQTFVERGLEADELCIISADTELPYERPPLSKAFLAGDKEFQEIQINEPSFYEEHGIAVRLETRVDAADLPDKRLKTNSGDEIEFEKLLIATGSRLRTLDLPGATLDGLLYLRQIDDARQIRVAVEDAERAVLVGGGFIGMEVASQLARKGLETTIVFPEDRIMADFFTPHMSAFFQRYYRERDVDFVPRARVESFDGKTKISTVTLRSGQELSADLVIAGIGVEPATELFQEGPLASDEGIVVNEYLETEVPDVYAAGDVANYRDVIFERQRHLEHWDNAAQQGKHVARVMMGEREPFKKVPYFFSDVFDLSWEFWGDTTGADWVLHRGQVDSGSFSVWWLTERRVIGAFVMDRPEEERKVAQRWIEKGVQVPPELLADANQTLG